MSGDIEVADKLSDASVLEDFSSPIVRDLLRLDSSGLAIKRFDFRVPVSVQDEGERLIAGYASVEIIDRQGDLIPLDTLKKAWDHFTANPDFQVSMVMHSNIPVGKILIEHPKVQKKSGVDETGLFVIVKLRDDIQKANETWELIKSGKLKAFSIGGEALHKTPVSDGRRYDIIDGLELHEISIVDVPANPASTFSIIKRFSEGLIKIDDVLRELPKGIVLFRDYIDLVGSVAEKGESKHDFDLLVRDTQDSPLKRHILTRFQKLFPDDGVGQGGPVHLFWGDPQGPHDSYYPVYDLVLLRRESSERVPMSIPSSAGVEGTGKALSEPNASFIKQNGEPLVDDPTKNQPNPSPALAKDTGSSPPAPAPATPPVVDVASLVLELKGSVDKLKTEFESLKAKPKDEEYPAPDEGKKRKSLDSFFGAEKAKSLVEAVGLVKALEFMDAALKQKKPEDELTDEEGKATKAGASGQADGKEKPEKYPYPEQKQLDKIQSDLETAMLPKVEAMINKALGGASKRSPSVDDKTVAKGLISYVDPTEVPADVLVKTPWNKLEGIRNGVSA
jgi:HK97 family phage prohead protease